MKRENKAAVLFTAIVILVFLGLWIPEPLPGSGKAETALAVRGSPDWMVASQVAAGAISGSEIAF